VRGFRFLTTVSALSFGWGGAQLVEGQVPAHPAARTSREEILAGIAEAEKTVNSPGYSSRIKQAKRREIALLQARLRDGDLQAGDQIVLSVQDEPKLTGTFTVTAGRFITLPGVGDVPLQGVLRSELPERLTSELQKYLRDPVVHVRTTVRVSVLGAVGKPGFYQVPSETMIGDAIMLAGGPGAGADPSKSRVERAGAEIMSREAFAQALMAGKTLDQMNLQAGDELLVGGSRTIGPSRNLMNVGLPIVTGLASLALVFSQIF